MTLLTHPLLGHHPGDACVLVVSFYLLAGGGPPAHGLHVEKAGQRPAGRRWGEVYRPASKVSKPRCQYALGRELCLILNPPNTKQFTQRDPRGAILLDLLPPRRPRDFPGGSDGKASAYNAGDLGSIPGSGRSPGEGNGNPLQYSCLENPMDGRAW